MVRSWPARCELPTRASARLFMRPMKKLTMDWKMKARTRAKTILGTPFWTKLVRSVFQPLSMCSRKRSSCATLVVRCGSGAKNAMGYGVLGKRKIVQYTGYWSALEVGCRGWRIRCPVSGFGRVGCGKGGLLW